MARERIRRDHRDSPAIINEKGWIRVYARALITTSIQIPKVRELTRQKARRRKQKLQIPNPSSN